MKPSYPLIICAFLLSCIVASANGDPVIRYSSVTRSGNPVPRTVSEVEIVHESLTITPGVPYTRIHVEYTLRNNSNLPIKDIDYGFPIDYEGTKDKRGFRDDGFTESIYETGWWDKNIKDVSFSLNGQMLPWHSADEIVSLEHREAYERNADPDNPEDWYDVPQISRLWTYTQFSIQARETVVLGVTYYLYHKQIMSVYPSQYSFMSRYYTTSGVITYDFTPAQHWGCGKAGSIDISITLSDSFIWRHENTYNGKSYISQSPDINWTGFIRQGNSWNYHAEAFDFAKSEPLEIDFWPYYTSRWKDPEPWREMKEFEIASELYQVSSSSPESVDISFNEPTYVTDMSFCDADAWQSRSSYNGNMFYHMPESRYYTITSILVTFADGEKSEAFREYQWTNDRYDNRFKTYYVTLNSEADSIWGKLYKDEDGVYQPMQNYDNRISHIQIFLSSNYPDIPLKTNPITNVRFYRVE